jgi:hypothetical protein
MMTRWGFLLAGLSLLAATPAGAVSVGETAPDFLVQNVNSGDSPIILSSYRGQVVLLTLFWTG